MCSCGEVSLLSFGLTCTAGVQLQFALNRAVGRQSVECARSHAAARQQSSRSIIKVLIVAVTSVCSVIERLVEIQWKITK